MLWSQLIVLKKSIDTIIAYYYIKEQLTIIRTIYLIGFERLSLEEWVWED